MLRAIVIISICTNLIKIESEYTHRKCYRISNGNGKIFPIYWKSEVSEIPSNIYVEHDISDAVFGFKSKNAQRFDASIIDGSCDDEPIISSNFVSLLGEKKRMVIAIYHGHGDYEYDRVIADLQHGFPSQLEILTGLSGLVQIPVYFNSTLYDLPNYKHSHHDYYQRLPPLLTEKFAYCAKSVGVKDKFSLRMDGSELRKDGAFDHYILSIKVKSYYGYFERKKFLLKAFLCGKATQYPPLKIYSREFEKVEIEIKDGYSQQILINDYLYQEYNEPYLLDMQSKNVDLHSIEVLDVYARDFCERTDGIKMYAPWYDHVKCKHIDELAFVDLMATLGCTLQKNGFFADRNSSSDKITRIKPGSLEEVDKCLAGWVRSY